MRYDKNQILLNNFNDFNLRMLQKYLNKLTDENNNSKIFFPLCGKAVDMAWYNKHE